MIKKPIFMLAVLFTAFMLGFNIPTKKVYAHELPTPYRWYTSTSKHQNINTSRAWAVTEAASAYNATDLTSTATTNATGDGIIYYQVLDLGAGGPIGRTIAYSVNNQACANISNGSLTGNCNTTDKKAKMAYVYLNEPTYTTYINNNTRFVYRHETGHAFGLGHVECTTASIMGDVSCPQAALTAHDTNDINGWYYEE